jgi:hypothetical protein
MGDLRWRQLTEVNTIERPDWLSNNQTTQARNEILVQLLDEDRRTDMIQVL